MVDYLAHWRAGEKAENSAVLMAMSWAASMAERREQQSAVLSGAQRVARRAWTMVAARAWWTVHS